MDTIFAVSSGVGRSAIAVIRLSGPSCGDIGRLFCGRDLSPRQATISSLRDPTTGHVLDYALCLAFVAPASFTGEDCLELHIHGGRAVVQSVLAALGTVKGLRPAEPGEFTRRAFQYGKLTIDSAEGLADLIQADTEYQQRLALNAMSGKLDSDVDRWRKMLIEVQARLDAWLDFPDENEVSDGLIDECDYLISALITELNAAIAAGRRAEIVRDGFKVVIAGPPNAGKSSLLNRLAQRDAVIVSNIPGTTRDIVEVGLDIDGVPVSFLDGAGIRATHDPIEKLGIERVKGAVERAQAVVWLTPVDEPIVEPPSWIDDSDATLLRVASKIDLIADRKEHSGVSVLTGTGISEFIVEIGAMARQKLTGGESRVLLRERHFKTVTSIVASLDTSSGHLKAGLAELAAEELRHCFKSLATVSKPVHNEDVLDAVFSRFCIGK